MVYKTMNIVLSIILLFVSLPLFAVEKADKVIVIKSNKKMYLKNNNKILKEYNVVFGANPNGHKQYEGDERTPEGQYILDYKKSDSAYYKAIHISYPNEQDKQQAKAKGVNAGGQIMIHGQPNGLGRLAFLTQQFNWTDGCIAVTNKEMNEIWAMVDAGTPIDILP